MERETECSPLINVFYEDTFLTRKFAVMMNFPEVFAGWCRGTLDGWIFRMKEW